MAGIVVKPRARILRGHDWVYGTEVLKVFGEPQAGDVISLKDGKDRSLGSAIYNPNSQIVARRFSRRKQTLDFDFFVRRIRQAVESRRKFGAYRDPGRLVWSESDGLPGVIIDQYAGNVVLQTLTFAMDQKKELIVEAIKQSIEPLTIIERNDAPIRKAEGLQLVTSILYGIAPNELQVEIGGLKFAVDLLSGHKTGFYLDQVENYQTVAGVASNAAVLDCFSNQGAFAIACAKAGATRVQAVEASSDLVSGIQQNAALNGQKVEPIQKNVFDYLSEQIRANAQFDLIILDPPSFTKSKDNLDRAWRGYKEIHLRALQLLSPDGYLATFSCSHHVSRQMFLDLIVESTVDARKYVRVIRNLSQALDHPILPHIPETEYLKGFLLQAIPGR